MAVEHVQPDITRPNAGLAWSVCGRRAPDRQRAAMNAAADGFQRLGLTDGFLSLHFLICPEYAATCAHQWLSQSLAQFAASRHWVVCPVLFGGLVLGVPSGCPRRGQRALIQPFPSAAIPSRMCSVWANPAASRLSSENVSVLSSGSASGSAGSTTRISLVGPLIRVNLIV